MVGLGDPQPASAIASDSFSFLGSGEAGDLTLTGDGVGSRLEVADDAGVFASTDTTGDGGNLTIEFDRVEVGSGGRITVASTSAVVPEGQTPGVAGNLSLIAHDLVLTEQGSIIAESKDGDGGNIAIAAGNGVELLNGSSITAEVGGGPETTGGNITIAQPDWVILDNGSRIVANAFEGQGGNIGIETKALLVSSDSTISASSALGVSGVVAVNAPDTDIIAGLSTLPQEFLDAAQLSRGRCGTPGTGDVGNFAVYDSPGVPPPPDAPLPSLLMEVGECTPAMGQAWESVPRTCS